MASLQHPREKNSVEPSCDIWQERQRKYSVLIKPGAQERITCYFKALSFRSWAILRIAQDPPAEGVVSFDVLDRFHGILPGRMLRPHMLVT